MLIISFGMVKSGSTFSFQMQRDCLYASGMSMVDLKREHFPDTRWGNGGGVESSHNLVDLQSVDIEYLARKIPDDKLFVVKTHSAPTEKVVEMMQKGHVSACVTWRDPRECMISLQDIAVFEKDVEAYRQRFVDSADFQNALTANIGFVHAAEQWLALPDILPIPYEKLRINPYSVANDFCKKFSLGTPPDGLVDFYLSNKKRIGEFNKGVPGRWMDVYPIEQIEMMNTHFGEFVDKYCKSENYGFENSKDSEGIPKSYPQTKFSPEYWVEELCVFSSSYFRRMAEGNPQSFEEIACSLTNPDDGRLQFREHMINCLGMSEVEADAIIERIDRDICAPYRQ